MLPRYFRRDYKASLRLTIQSHRGYLSAATSCVPRKDTTGKQRTLASYFRSSYFPNHPSRYSTPAALRRGQSRILRSATPIPRRNKRDLPTLIRRSTANSTSRESDLVVVIDMDECLIHTHWSKPAMRTSAILAIPWPDKTTDTIFVHLRPHVVPFLQSLTQSYECHVFTAAQKDYADAVLDRLCEMAGTQFEGRWFRDSCTALDPDDANSQFAKDLNVLQRPLERVILVDNNPYSAILQPDNLLEVSDFYGDSNDRVLWHVEHLIRNQLDPATDVRRVLRHMGTIV